jgi:hypothetical protein
MNASHFCACWRVLAVVILVLEFHPAPLRAAELSEARVELWDFFELRLEGPSTGNPFVDVNLSATFSQGAKRVEVAGFYDGEGIYRVRFMPTTKGAWQYETHSNASALNAKTGRIISGKPSHGNDGPVVVHNTYHFEYADGRSYFPVGTTCYAWIHQGDELEEKTLATLKTSPFNKLRMCIFPKWYEWNRTEPPLYPFEGIAPKAWDLSRFNPKFFQHLEKRIGQLRDLGIEADLILFHPYDEGHWGFDRMPAEADDRYVKYVIARLAVYRNVWWSMANEFDFMKQKTDSDWDRLFQVVQQNDPYGHLRSIHNGLRMYNHNKPWVTHASIQNGSAVTDFGRGVLYRDVYRKPIVFDEVKYEGDIEKRLGNLSPEEMVYRFWEGTAAGTYVGHGETYRHPSDILWWSKGGVLRGQSPPRLAFLRKVLEDGPEEGMEPIDKWQDDPAVGKPGEYYVLYFGKNRPTEWTFKLPKAKLSTGMAFQVEVLDTWEMTTTPVDGLFRVQPDMTRNHFVADGSVKLPGKPYIALRIRRAPGAARWSPGDLPAFPGAEGFGANTPGGRGGKVYEVTNLNDRGPGSLREAIEATGPRIVVFRVSGTITLESDLEIKNPNITIAGQTAPGDGICLRKHKLGIATNDVIVRYLRVRRGDESGEPDDGIGIYDAENVIVDHCSVSWTCDEAVNTWHHVRNATVQWCIVSEPLHDSIQHGHGFAMSIGGDNTSYHHNLIANSPGRNPSIGGNRAYVTTNLDFRNNAIFNFEHRVCDGKPKSANIINNYYKPGPSSQFADHIAKIDQPTDMPLGQWYIGGNEMEGQPRILADNWSGVTGLVEARVNQPFVVAPIKTSSARDAYDQILADAGATLPRRDSVDTRIIGETRTGKTTYGNGVVQSPRDVGGWPELKSRAPDLDSDHDGIPDWWEPKYGLNPNDPTDANKDLNGDGYTNLEKYLNGIDPTKKIDWRNPENNRNTLAPGSLDGPASLLNRDVFQHYVDRFNGMENENVVNLIPNAQSWDWLKENVPAFECPDDDINEIYWYRWWTYRKHIRQFDGAIAITEFLTFKTPVSSAVGHHVMEGRWIHSKKYVDQDLLYWLRGTDGRPHDVQKYSSWTAWSAYQRYLVNRDKAFIIGMLDDFIRDYSEWEQKRLGPSGLFWQFDVRDAMEESISGSRKNKNSRPSINSYMYGNALAIAHIAELAGKTDVAKVYRDKAAKLKKLVQENLWDTQAQFFKVQLEDGSLSGAREAIGFIPWYFELPDRGNEAAWTQLPDDTGFRAPFGFTTAERRHPLFRTHGSGHGCEWDGPVWPFATSQTLTALANVLNDYPQKFVTRQDYFDGVKTYVKSHHRNGRPYLGEYLDEKTGEWLKGDNERSRYYNHSTFADLIITGLVGLRPRTDDTIEVNPLMPSDAWDWFCLDRVLYHGHSITILWDRTGQKYGKGVGLSVLANGLVVAHSKDLNRVTGTLK